MWPRLRLARVRCERESVGVVLARRSPVVLPSCKEVLMGRSIGLDVHRDFCEVAIADGGRARSAGRIATDPKQIELFAGSLAPNDRVVLEATGNALAIARILEPHVAEVVLAHAKDVRAISHARVKTDKIDARVLADLLAAGLIPQVWIGDERCRMLRRLVSRRRALVKRRSVVHAFCADVAPVHHDGGSGNIVLYDAIKDRWQRLWRREVGQRVDRDGYVAANRPWRAQTTTGGGPSPP
jgi:transposase